MDPNACLSRIFNGVSKILEQYQELHLKSEDEKETWMEECDEQLAEVEEDATNLVDWIAHGGFKPTDPLPLRQTLLELDTKLAGVSDYLPNAWYLSGLLKK